MFTDNTSRRTCMSSNIWSSDNKGQIKNDFIPLLSVLFPTTEPPSVSNVSKGLMWSSKFISRHASLSAPLCNHVLEAENSLHCWHSLSMALWRRTLTYHFAHTLFLQPLTNVHHSPSRMGDQPLHVKPLSCPLCSLIKIRFCLCCHIWYGFPACTLGWGPSHSL